MSLVRLLLCTEAGNPMLGGGALGRENEGATGDTSDDRGAAEL